MFDFEQVEGNTIHGTFAVSFMGATTRPIHHDSTETQCT
jgi:hypothetical protein